MKSPAKISGRFFMGTFLRGLLFKFLSIEAGNLIGCYTESSICPTTIAMTTLANKSNNHLGDRVNFKSHQHIGICADAIKTHFSLLTPQASQPKPQPTGKKHVIHHCKGR